MRQKEYKVEKTCGSFVTVILRNLKIDDLYKYLMYLLLNKEFQILSGEVISELSGTLIPFTAKYTKKDIKRC